MYRFLLHALLRLLFGFKVFGKATLKCEGPVILAPNHVSWLDWLFLGAVLDKDWLFVTSAITAKTSWVHRKIMTCSRCIPIDPASAYTIKHLAEILSNGGKLVIFPEGRISNTGELSKVQPGVQFLIQKTGAKVILAYLRGARYLKWVRHTGHTRWFPRVTLHLENLQVSISPERDKQISWLRDKMLEQQVGVNLNYGPQTIPEVVRSMFPLLKKKVVWQDFKFGELTYRKLVLGATLIGGVLKKKLKPSDGNRVGVVLPGVNAAPVALLALWILGKTPTMFNFSAGIKTICDCAKLAKLKQVVSSKNFVEQTHFDVEALKQIGVEMVYLEDVKPEITLGAKIFRLLWSRCPICREISAQSPGVILFTSGSEGVPKGVELTHRNLIADIEQAIPAAEVADSNRIFNALPIFHGFGLLLGITVPMVRGVYCFNYPSPLHYRIIPSLLCDRACTVFCGTNTFMNGYAHYAGESDFRSLRLTIVGGEKMQQSTVKTFAEKFQVLLSEGYGVTECSPVIGVNTPQDHKAGSIGRALPCMQTKLIPVEGISEGGRLLVKGPNVMRGYLNEEANAEFQAMDGWYDTGDIATIDGRGFITLLGRVKRFAKIGGEMISLTSVEDTLREAITEFGDKFQLAVTVVESAERGEALVVVTNEARLTDARVRDVIKSSGLSNLCTPKSLMVVDELPKLGTGKIDYITLKQMAATK